MSLNANSLLVIVTFVSLLGMGAAAWANIKADVSSLQTGQSFITSELSDVKAQISRISGPNYQLGNSHP